jgi:hypothetical protein
MTLSSVDSSRRTVMVGTLLLSAIAVAVLLLGALLHVLNLLLDSAPYVGPCFEAFELLHVNHQTERQRRTKHLESETGE